MQVAFTTYCLLLTFQQHNQLGGINMVDVQPYGGDYSGVVVRGNTILGGFADDPSPNEQAKGDNSDHAIMKCVHLPS